MGDFPNDELFPRPIPYNKFLKDKICTFHGKNLLISAVCLHFFPIKLPPIVITNQA